MVTQESIRDIGECMFNVTFRTFYTVYSERYNQKMIGYVMEKYEMMQNDTANYLASHNREFADVLQMYRAMRDMPKFGKTEVVRQQALLDAALKNK